MCKCDGCEGYPAFKARQAAEMAAKRERFEQWYAEQQAAELAKVHR